ncbi:hypothetical protein FE257_010202 [Aspergillus nanangensis]|uniref:R3H domain protein n=1 Tax=Aspergillus nanangensis TaxID=2582783 RepID=A0AAD4GSD5_ASPNN|nr:hypothetical protein FE257_010202 [Aspergillus nanangensis]
MSLSKSLSETNAMDRSVDRLARAVQDVHIVGKKALESPELSSESHENGALKRETSFEDDRTHLSNSSTKPTSFDSKSMASVTTFAMDEKDSLRPDDSASVQAIDEEECLSGPASGAPNSLTGSESGARGLRDLQRARSTLQNTGPMFNDGVQQDNGVMMPDSISNNYGIPAHDVFQNGQPITMHPFPLEPDEKLLEAMKSPKDRLLILQLEEKVRHFIQNSKEQSLELPPSNAFGRLLAHKLGDYYHLTHFVDNNVTSVRLHRTPFCRLPTPLSVIHASTNSTPPPAMPAMKIMRRNDGRPSTEGSTADSSAVPSKTGSEAGDSTNDGDRGGSSAGATPAKDRFTLTREEREAKYQEARERIFRDFPESKSSDGGNGDQSANMSRSSSTSGRKKNQRQKTPHDDSFEVRSQYNVYYPGMNYPQGPQPYNGAMNDPSVPNQPPYMVGPGATPPGMGYAPPPGQNATMYTAPMNMNSIPPQYSMPVSPQMTPSGPWQNGTVPPSPYSGYASINQSPGMATKPPPAMSNYPTPNSVQYQHTPPGWSPPQFHGGYQGSTQRNPSTMAWPTYPSQPMNPTSYPYTQYPGQHMNPAMQNSPGGHPMPGSFNRSPFNPQTRSFIPAGAPLGRQPSTSSQHGMHAFAATNGGGYPPQWVGRFPEATKHQEIPTGPRGPMPGTRDSIAKWGTPSHLPPKPPPSEVPSEFDLKHRANATHPANPIPNTKNGPLVVSGGTSLPRPN